MHITDDAVRAAKTGLAQTYVLYGGEKLLITINLSEYQEPHTVSQLQGSPPGYVGYGQGGILTEAVSKRLHRHYGLSTNIEESHYDALTAACLWPDTGARNVDSLLNQQILPVLSQQLLTHMAAKQKPHSLTLGSNDEEGIEVECSVVAER